MTKFIKFFTLILMIFLYGFVFRVNAATINAASCSRSDVVSAISSASDGDTVTIPSGNCTWNSHITLNKEIAIIGAGIGSTVITNHGFTLNAPLHNWRISGIEWTTSSVSNAIYVPGGGNKGHSEGFQNIRIDHCKFTGYDRFLYFNGKTTGVIDHCQFIGGGHARIVFFSGATASWDEDPSYGTSDWVFIEDCTFDNNGEGVTHFVDGARGAKYVVRHNTFIERSADNVNDWITMHGLGHGGGQTDRSMRAFEVYENTFQPGYSGWQRCFQIRGGSGVIYNNTFDESSASFDTYFFFREMRVTKSSAITGSVAGCESCGFSCNRWCSTADGGEGYPCCDQIGRGKDQASEPVYIWGNKDHNENAKNAIVLESAALEDYIQEDRDYYLSQKPGYIPYTYPHPLTNTTTGEGAPSAPTNLRTISD